MSFESLKSEGGLLDNIKGMEEIDKEKLIISLKKRVSVLCDYAIIKDKEIQLLKTKIKELQDKQDKLELKKTIKNERGAGRKAFDDVHTIELIKKMKKEGNGITDIARYLNENGIKTKRGGNWAVSSVKLILDRNN